MDIISDLQKTECISGSSLQTCGRYARLARYTFAFTQVLQFIKGKAQNLFGLTHPDKNTFLSSNAIDGVFHLKAAATNLFNEKKPKRGSPPNVLPLPLASTFSNFTPCVN